MTDKPIIIPTIRIPALRDGRMTQMRVPLKRLPLHKPQPHTITYHKGKLICRWWSGARHDLKSPYSIGDRLWCRETWALNPAVRRSDRRDSVLYKADFPTEEPPLGDVLTIERLNWAFANAEGPKIGWRSPVTMPRWASRTTLVVNEVRVQRVQEISAEDCEREGIKISDGALFRDGYMVANRKDFRWLWNATHGPDAWDRNDWVCAISFDVHLCNIDQMPGDV